MTSSNVNQPDISISRSTEQRTVRTLVVHLLVCECGFATNTKKKQCILIHPIEKPNSDIHSQELDRSLMYFVEVCLSSCAMKHCKREVYSSSKPGLSHITKVVLVGYNASCAITIGHLMALQYNESNTFFSHSHLPKAVELHTNTFSSSHIIIYDLTPCFHLRIVLMGL